MSAKALFLWIVFRRVSGASSFWIDVAGVRPLLFDCIEVPSTLASASAGRFFACSRFRGSGRGVE
ncbi:hypothetical protein, partial [Burkholderia cepacia]|uniref:hypothetical protein n=1 Tax=Burkholderia cepacia TaxID=292 RepID=UPI0019552715